MKAKRRPTNKPVSERTKFRSIEEVAALTGWAPNTVRKYLRSGMLKIKADGKFEALLETVQAFHRERVDLKAGSVECRGDWAERFSGGFWQ
jgi:hypothetical protein